MSTDTIRLQVPEGVHDRLPREAARMRRLFGRLDGLFRVWGYHEVVTPGFEYLETVTAGTGSLGRRESLYQFFDRRGRTLTLRPDMTRPIARMVATKMAGEPLPLRLSYFAPVYRHRGREAGSASEIWQAGIEVVGAESAAADAEVIALACAALAAAGLEGYKIGLGHADLVEGLFAEVGLAPALEEELKEALIARDLVAFEKGVAQSGLAPERAELLLSLVHFRGTCDQARSRFVGLRSQRVARALDRLDGILQLLEALGVAGQVSLDLGLVRGLGYYTGVLFEGYAPGVGSPVLGGGRYDNLLAEFGGAAPATGFALEADRLLTALAHQRGLEEEHGVDVLVASPPGREAEAMKQAHLLRQQGLSVAVDLLGRTGAELLAEARARGATSLVAPDGTEPAEPTLQSGGRSGGQPARPRMAGFSSIH